MSSLKKREVFVIKKKRYTFTFFFKKMLKLRSFSTSCIKRNIFDASPLKVLKPLQAYAPTFYTHGDNIKPLYEPSQFYSQLKVKQLILPSSLYTHLFVKNTQQQQKKLHLHSQISCKQKNVFLLPHFISDILNKNW